MEPEMADAAMSGDDGASAVTAPGFDIQQLSARMSQDHSTTGAWIWTQDFVDLNDEVITVYEDPQSTKVLYAGGVDFIQVSNDAGETWMPVYSMSSDVPTLAKGENVAFDDSEIIDKKRTLIEDELESVYGADFTETIMDTLDDDDILSAKHTDDISELSNYEISLDLSTVAYDNGLVSSLDQEEEEVDDDKDLSELNNQDLINRYRILLSLGATEEAALDMLAQTKAAWQFFNKGNSTYAVTSDALLMTKDKGKSWKPVLTAQDGQPLFAGALSPDGRSLFIGGLNVLRISEDAGKTWNDVPVPGAVFKVLVTSDREVVIGSTEGIYTYSVEGKQLQAFNIPVLSGEMIVDFDMTAMNNSMFITESNLYLFDGVRFERVLGMPFSTQPLRQINLVPGEDASHPIVRTELAVYELGEHGWFCHDEGIFGELTRHMTLSPSKDRTNAAIMVTNQGVMVAARNRGKLSNPDKLDYLKRLWSQEPSEGDVIQAALRLYGLDQGSDNLWKSRLWVSMVLPDVKFDYVYKPQVTDRAQRVITFKNNDFWSDVPTWNQNHSTVSYWQIMAHWNLNFDEYTKQEITLDQLYVQQETQRRKIIYAVTRAFNKRHALQMQSLKRRPNLKNDIKRDLQIEKLEVQLYYMTGGYFKPKDFI